MEELVIPSREHLQNFLECVFRDVEKHRMEFEAEAERQNTSVAKLVAREATKAIEEALQNAKDG